jgi:Putative addiction module component
MRLGECVTGTDAAAESHVPKIQGGALRGENAFCLAGQSAQCHDTKMSEQLTLEKIRQLSVSERLRLIEDVWASLSETPERIEVPDWHRAQLDALWRPTNVILRRPNLGVMSRRISCAMCANDVSRPPRGAG